MCSSDLTQDLTHFERDHSCSVENELGIQGDKSGHGRTPAAWSRGGGAGAEGSRLMAQFVGLLVGGCIS